MKSGNKTIKKSAGSGIRLIEVRIRNFRCLESIDVVLDEMNVLVGENNSGKTSFLDALHAAIGVGTRNITEEDIYLAAGEVRPPKMRQVTIDVLIRPTDSEGRIIDIFPQGSPWLESWGNGIAQDDDGNDIVAIRTQMRWNAVRGEYLTERRFLKDWQVDPADWELSAPVERTAPVSNAQIEPFGLYYLDAARDIANDIRNRTSFWSKMVSDLDLSENDIAAIEKALTGINEKIIDGSEVLAHVQRHLDSFNETLPNKKNSVSITPIARHIRDLNKGMDVLMAAGDSPAFPLMKQGMGTRSLGTVLAFRAYMTWKVRQSKGRAAHPMVAIEEPETHLHPQAQRALYRQIELMPGQRIISTHSPYICAQADITQLRHFRKLENATRVSWLNKEKVKALSNEDIRKINRQVMNTRGDIVFARGLVLFEGETEEQALPGFAEKYWGRIPSGLGISMVGVNGYGGYLPFLRLAESYGILWFIFSDGEKEAISSINKALAAIGRPGIPDNPDIICLPNGVNFEKYLAKEYRQPLVNMIIDAKAISKEHRAALVNEWKDKSEAEFISELEHNKTYYGAVIGNGVRNGCGKQAEFPVLITDLLQYVSSRLDLL